MIFSTDPEEIADWLRTDRLAAALSRYSPGTVLSDEYLAGKLAAAIRDLEVRLHVFLEPVEVLPSGATADEIEALDGARFVREPGYDIPLNFFRDAKWGFTVLRHPPVIEIHSVKFTYPTTTDTVLAVPDDWVRCDLSFGHLQLVPTGAASIGAAPFAFFGGGLWRGGNVPQMMQVRYRSGIEDVETAYPDVVDILGQMTALSVMDDLLLPGSGSQSIDGMSQSFSADMKVHRERIDQRINRLRDTLIGVRGMVFG